MHSHTHTRLFHVYLRLHTDCQDYMPPPGRPFMGVIVGIITGVTVLG
jgi:hypothetical protein